MLIQTNTLHIDTLSTWNGPWNNGKNIKFKAICMDLLFVNIFPWLEHDDRARIASVNATHT